MLVMRFPTIYLRHISKQWARSIRKVQRRPLSSATHLVSSSPATDQIEPADTLCNDSIYGDTDRRSYWLGQHVPRESSTDFTVHNANLEEPVHRLVSFKDQKGFQEQYEIQLALAECPYLHTFTDVSQYRRSFVFRRPLLDPPTTLAPFMSVNTSGMEVPWEPARQILKDVLHGIARMHSHDIIHTNIHADHVYLDYHYEVPEDTEFTDEIPNITQIQLAGLEHAVKSRLEPNMRDEHTTDKTYAVHAFQSPEAIVGGPVGKASDMFSFGALCMCSNYYTAPFCPDGFLIGESEPAELKILTKHVSYLADEDEFICFLRHIGRNPWAQKLVDAVNSGLITDHPSYHIDGWAAIYGEFGDLVKKLLTLDPEGRITAEQALAHPWFAE